MSADIKSRIREQALALGFDAVGFAPALWYFGLGVSGFSFVFSLTAALPG